MTILKYLVVVFLAFLLSLSHLIAQTISGRLQEEQSGKAIVAATVLVKSKNQKILGFKASDALGHFQIAVKNLDSVAYIEVNHIGFRKYHQAIQQPFEGLILNLEASSTVLETIQVKSRPAIQQNGDTVAYAVDRFTKDYDRTIGDVLKRMPGIEVGENGSIKYQGKAISKFYIDHDDLLDDRYGIGTKTIPHGMVKDVQVLKNHQPLKVLENKALSDDVALNLVIKDDARLKMTGQVKIGAGLPHQYDGELNSILFNKKQKYLHVLQGNNIGNDLSADFVGFNKTSILSKMGQTKINNLLSLGTVGSPPLSSNYYLRNNHVSLQTNNLVHLGKEWQLKSNLQTMYGDREDDFRGLSNYLLEDGTILQTEEQNRQAREWIASLRLTALKNTKDKYLENALVLEYENELAHAQITANHLDQSGKSKQHIIGLSNQFNYTPKMKNNDILTVDWYLDYGGKPQQLNLLPGVFANELNAGNIYAQTLQMLEVPTLFSRAALGYRIPKGRIKQYYQLSATLDQQKLRSHIEIQSNGQWTSLSLDSTKNNLDWNRYQLAGLAQYEWNHKRLAARLSLPLSFQLSKYEDLNLGVQEQIWKPLFTANLMLKLKVYQEDEWQWNISRGHSFGNIDQVYRGMIIQNYRNLAFNQAKLQEQQTLSVGMNYQFARTLKMFFANAGINYQENISSSMLSTEVNNQQNQTQLLDRENRIKTYSTNIGFDKYIFGLGSSIKWNASWSQTAYQQLFNQQMLDFKQNTYQVLLQLETKIWKGLNLSYSNRVNWTNNQTKPASSALNRQTFNLNQNLSFPLSLWQSVYLNVTARHLFSKQPNYRNMNYFFLDAFARYRLKKWNTDLELNMKNLANVKTYETYLLQGNLETHHQYPLRGRMLILKAIFNFK